jgi:hypothetical protein
VSLSATHLTAHDEGTAIVQARKYWAVTSCLRLDQVMRQGRECFRGACRAFPLGRSTGFMGSPAGRWRAAGPAFPPSSPAPRSTGAIGESSPPPRDRPRRHRRRSSSRHRGRHRRRLRDHPRSVNYSRLNVASRTSCFDLDIGPARVAKLGRVHHDLITRASFVVSVTASVVVHDRCQPRNSRMGPCTYTCG